MEKGKPIEFPLEGIDQLKLFGLDDINLKAVEELSNCKINVRNGKIKLSGADAAVWKGAQLVDHIIQLVQRGSEFDVGDIRRFNGDLDNGIAGKLTDLEEQKIYLTGLKRLIQPRSVGQRVYLQAIEKNDIVVCIGPAGTGKTYLAVAAAIDQLNKKRVKRIVLARPAVEAGERLGFLPGDLQEKVDPYLRPLYDALHDMLPSDKVRRYLDTLVIEIAPLAYMRGRTLNDSFVILDEAQNTTSMQMKMALTRLGYNSKAVITGDKTQIDLPENTESGLLQVERILKSIDGIEFVYLTPHDVVRHPLVQDIIRAYADESNKNNKIKSGS